jgi:hypothetical protein
MLLLLQSFRPQSLSPPTWEGWALSYQHPLVPGNEAEEMLLSPRSSLAEPRGGHVGFVGSVFGRGTEHSGLCRM